MHNSSISVIIVFGLSIKFPVIIHFSDLLCSGSDRGPDIPYPLDPEHLRRGGRVTVPPRRYPRHHLSCHGGIQKICLEFFSCGK